MLKRLLDTAEKTDADGRSLCPKRFCPPDREPAPTDENAYSAIRSRASSTSTLSMMDVDQEEDMDEILTCSDQVMGVGNEMPERDDDANDVILSVITGKRPRYTRKIDVLVDDLIRKTKRSLDWNNRSDTGSGGGGGAGSLLTGDLDLFLPEIRTPGPQPGSDQRLMGKSRHRENDMLSLVVFQDPDGDDGDDGNEVEERSSHSVNFPIETERNGNTHSGDISHSDWPIEYLE
jgi:hypothetical protein